MIVLGLFLLIAAALLAGIGLAGYQAARRSASKSRYAALTLFGHGALASSGLTALALFVRVHSLWPLQVEVRSASVVLATLIDCDIEADCVALTILAIVGLVLTASFLVSQGSARRLLRTYARRSDPAAARHLAQCIRLAPRTRLLVVRDADPDAFSMAILRFGGRRLVRAEDVVVLTSALLGILAEDEAEAVVAHEVAHVAARDDRYLAYLRVLSTILFFDPILRVLRRRVGRHHEFAADAEAAKATRRPLSLARALLKVYLNGTAGSRASSFFGRGDRGELLERIEALLALDDAASGGTIPSGP